MRCPKCRKTLYSTCGNPECVCAKSVPPGKLVMLWDDTGNLQICPHCGYTNDASFWEDRYCDEFKNKHGVKGFVELKEKIEKFRNKTFYSAFFPYHTTDINNLDDPWKSAIGSLKVVIDDTGFRKTHYYVSRDGSEKKLGRKKFFSFSEIEKDISRGLLMDEERMVVIKDLSEIVGGLLKISKK